MLRSLFAPALALLGGVLALAAVAAPAQADELGLIVERTTPTQKHVPVVLRSNLRGAIDIRVHRIGAPDALLQAGLDLSRGKALAFLGSGPDATAARRKDAALRSLYADASLSAAAERRARYQTPGKPQLESFRLPDPGLYLIEARAGELVARATALVSDLGVVVKRGPKAAFVWAVNRRTGKPWDGCRIRLRGTDTTHTCGPDGLIRIRAPQSATLDLLADASGHLAFGAETWFRPVSEDRRVYTFAHQPAYRPGESVEIYGIVRAYRDSAYALDASVGEVTVKLMDARGAIVATLPTPVSADLGTFRTSHMLDRGAPTGDWRIIVAIGPDEYEAPLKVDAYRKPAFEVRVAPKTRRVLAGQELTFDVSAAFYDGGIVAGAKVSWQLLYNRVDRELFPTEELVRVFFGTEREAYAPTTLKTGEGVLDAKGRLSISAISPPDAQDGYLSLRATVAGPDRMSVAGSGGASVAAAPVYVDIRSDKHLYGPEDEALVTIRVETADGGSAAGRAGVFTLATLTGAVAPAATEAWMQPRPFQTNDRGEATLRLTLPAEGRYRFMAAVPRTKSEPRGDPASAHIHAWVLGEKPTLGENPGHTLEVVADRDRYSIGDTARIMVRPPGAGRSVLAALEGASVLRTEVLDDLVVWTVRIEDAHAPNVFATFASVYRGELLLETRMLRIPPVQRLLNVEVAPDDGELLPGTASGASITITDHTGAPVADAEIALSIIDEALYALHADPSAPIEPFFHSLRRNNVRTTALLHHDCIDYVVGAIKKKAKDAQPGPSPSAPAGGVAPSRPSPPTSEAPSRNQEVEGRDGAEPEMDAEVPEETAELAEGDDGFDDERARRGGNGRARAPAKKDRKGAAPAALEARRDFRTCVYWNATLRTDARGIARIENVKFADSLTRWRVSVRVVDGSTRVGSGRATVRTRKTLTTDVRTPRFLRAGDRVSMPMLIGNRTRDALDVDLEWWTGIRAASTPDDELEYELGRDTTGTDRVAIKAGATTVREATFRSDGVSLGVVELAARSGTHGDKIRRTFPVLPQGIEKGQGITMRTANGTATRTVSVPKQAEGQWIRCEVSFEASAIQAVGAALPYLMDYPHGCTEQTMSRFGPVLDVQAAIATLGIKPTPRIRQLPAMQAAGLARLKALQHADGGYGWWPTDASSPVMTALVVRGLNRLLTLEPTQAEATELRTRAAAWLTRWWKKRAEAKADPATMASVLLALGGSGAKVGTNQLDALYDSKLPLAASPITRAWLLRAAHRAGLTDWTKQLAKALVDAAIHEGDLTHWAHPAPAPSDMDRGPVRWQEDSIEMTAEVLAALLETGTAPSSLLDRGAAWLMANRPGGHYWRSTRDTAAAVRFLAAHAAASPRLTAGQTVELSIDGASAGTLTIANRNELEAVLVLGPGWVKAGTPQEFTVTSDGEPVTAAIMLRWFEVGPAIGKASSGLTITRRYYQLTPVEQSDGGIEWSRTQVTETVPSGMLLECELTIRSDKPHEYLMVLDPHAAGFEPEQEFGMRVPGRAPAAGAHRERYDDRTAFFLTSMPPGETVLRHLVRATHVGVFTALPAQAELMYFPAVRGNSDGELLEVSASGEAGVKGDR